MERKEEMIMNIKKNLISNAKFMRLYDSILPYYCKMFPKRANKMLYKQTFQKVLDYNKVADFNEKINWLKVNNYNNNPLVIQCADKYKVRKYITENGYLEWLPELYFTWNSFEKIEWNKLPQSFVLKLNRASGMNILCPDKNKFNVEESKKEIKTWFTRETGERTCELHYGKAKPILMCEEYLHMNGEGKFPIDYKIHCFNGKPLLTLICRDRESGAKFVFVDNNYKHIPIDVKQQPESIIPMKPHAFEDMLKCAEKLATPFPFVRVDFYVINDKPYIGEMTFTPQGGFINYITEEGLRDLGTALQLK